MRETLNAAEAAGAAADALRGELAEWRDKAEAARREADVLRADVAADALAQARGLSDEAEARARRAERLREVQREFARRRLDVATTEARSSVLRARAGGGAGGRTGGLGGRSRRA